MKAYAVHYCLFNIFAATLHILRPSLPFGTKDMPEVHVLRRKLIIMMISSSSSSYSEFR